MEDETFRISISTSRAKALKEMALERLDDLKKEEKPYKIVEQYYEVIKELITALMYADGFKTLSHKALIDYLEKNYGLFFKREEFILLGEIRRLRNDILYYGRKIDAAFLINKESQLKDVINKLSGIMDKKLEEKKRL